MTQRLRDQDYEAVGVDEADHAIILDEDAIEDEPVPLPFVLEEEELVIFQPWEKELRKQVPGPVMDVWSGVVNDKNVRDAIYQSPAFTKLFNHVLKSNASRQTLLLAGGAMVSDILSETETVPNSHLLDDHLTSEPLYEASPVSDALDDEEEQEEGSGARDYHSTPFHTCENCGYATPARNIPRRERSNSNASTTSTRSCGSAGSPPRDNSPNGMDHNNRNSDTRLPDAAERIFSLFVGAVGVVVVVVLMARKGVHPDLCRQSFMQWTCPLVLAASQAVSQ